MISVEHTIIVKYEERLKLAMLQSDVTELEQLLAPELIYTNHFGQLMSKQDDLDAHRTGLLNINKIVISEQNIILYSENAIVTAHAHIVGSFSGIESENNFRFTRIWSKSSCSHWQVLVAHSTTVS
ncbi:hypothetical protein MNBD_GAMMA22-879 [hydrothermal vent metagenome]|uniref:DUF4440 domain-containing protein n=1 Tax=hydrothermal vent metagenome TaxID=652676 RepID=A0A3B1AN23_9ZZZZ